MAFCVSIRIIFTTLPDASFRFFVQKRTLIPVPAFTFPRPKFARLFSSGCSAHVVLTVVLVLVLLLLLLFFFQQNRRLETAQSSFALPTLAPTLPLVYVSQRLLPLLFYSLISDSSSSSRFAIASSLRQ